MSFWANLQLYTGKHYSPDLGNLTFISWEIQTGKSTAETVPPRMCV